MDNSLREQLLVALGSVVSSDALLAAGDLNFENYGRDETEDLYFAPDVVARPRAVEEVQAIVRVCSSLRVPIVARGGGTGLSGGALPVCGGVVLSLDRMNRILEIDRENFFLVAEPGVITQTLQEEVEKLGLFYPVDPASRGSCTIGGNVAEGAGGPRALKYGTTKDYVFGLDVVLADGSLAKFGGKRLKDVAGFNMAQLFVGSEGTLGVVVGVTLKLLPLPRFRRTLLAPFDVMDDAARAVPAILTRGVIPCALEFMERDCLKAIEVKRGEAVPFSDRAACLLIEVDGNDEATLEQEIAEIGAALDDCGAGDVFVAGGPTQQETIWAIRRAAGEAVKSICPYKEEDTVVPRSKLPELVRGVHLICERQGVRVICYGHAGDGNIHCNLLKSGLSDAQWRDDLPGVIREIFQLTVSLGGTITGEHGVGWVQKGYLPLGLGVAEIEAMRAIKRALDPSGIFNPDKIFP